MGELYRRIINPRLPIWIPAFSRSSAPRAKPCTDRLVSSSGRLAIPPGQIEHVEFDRGMTQQMGEVAEPLSLLFLRSR
jgi:hypothetical protein